MKTRKIYFAEEYRDKAGIGTTEYFSTAEEAIEYAKAEWRHLGEADKRSYITDDNGMFFAGQKWQTWDEDLEEWIDGDVIEVYHDCIKQASTASFIEEYTEFLQRIDKADYWNDIDVDDYEKWCEAVGLDYSSYDDPVFLFDDLIEKLAELRGDSLDETDFAKRINYIYA